MPNTPVERLSVLVVEDDEEDFFLTRSQLRRARSFTADVAWAETLDEGLAQLRSDAFDVALVDFRLGARTGLELIEEAVAENLTTPLVLLTGQDDLEVDLRASSVGAADFLVKGVDPAVLERSVRYARDRRRSEEQIRFQARLLDKTQDAILAFTPEGDIRYANRAAELLTGLSGEALLGDGDVFESSVPLLTDLLPRVLREGEWTGEIEVRRRDGQTLVTEARWSLVRGHNGVPDTVLASFTDVTERKALEVQFLRSQRMESIGRLVGGIAHDLGNLLVPVLLGAKVLQARFGEDEKAARTIGMIQKSAQRGADMVKQVLAFARGVEGDRVQLRVEDVVEEVAKMVDETFPATVDVEARIEPSLPPVVGDATQIQQVLMNLCVNARDAMPDGGRLVVEAKRAHVDARYAQVHVEAKEGDFVQLSVTDTGGGIPRDVLDKIFEPFFTTKSVEKGTGLGLSTVYSIIKSHGGFVSVYSEIGEGTAFNVYLPVSDKPEATVDAEVPEDVRGAGELVLVVDDEPFILAAAQDVLEHAGYAVVTAANGRLGLETYRARQADIALVLTDVMMPEMDGTTLIRHLRADGVTVPIVAASGMMGVKMEEVTAAGASAFLSKPFEAHRLQKTLHDLLHAAGREA